MSASPTVTEAPRAMVSAAAYSTAPMPSARRLTTGGETVADVLPHPGATATGLPMVEPDPCEAKAAKRDDASASLWAALVRGRVSPLLLVPMLLLAGGGGGIGGSWLLGPGGVADDARLRSDVAAIRTSLESCEKGIDALDEGQLDLYEAVSDTQSKHAKAITTIAVKLGIVETIDVSPPRQRARRVRR